MVILKGFQKRSLLNFKSNFSVSDKTKMETKTHQSRMCGKKESETDYNFEKTNYVLSCHLLTFGVILAMFLRSQSYDVDLIAHLRPQYGVK